MVQILLMVRHHQDLQPQLQLQQTTTSTATDSAPTTTALVFPRDDIYEVFPQGGLQGQPTSHISVIDNVGKHWWSGHTGYRSYFQNNRGNTYYYNFNCEIALFDKSRNHNCKNMARWTNCKSNFCVRNNKWLFL